MYASITDQLVTDRQVLITSIRKDNDRTRKESMQAIQSSADFNKDLHSNMSKVLQHIWGTARGNINSSLEAEDAPDSKIAPNLRENIVKECKVITETCQQTIKPESSPLQPWDPNEGPIMVTATQCGFVFTDLDTSVVRGNLYFVTRCPDSDFAYDSLSGRIFYTFPSTYGPITSVEIRYGICLPGRSAKDLGH